MARQTILFKELLLEIGYIEQIKTTRGNRGARNLVRLLLLSTKINLIRSTLYHWQPCVSKFCYIIVGRREKN